MGVAHVGTHQNAGGVHAAAHTAALHATRMASIMVDDMGDDIAVGQGAEKRKKKRHAKD